MVVLTLWLVPHSFTLLNEEKFTELSSCLIFLPKGNPWRIITKGILFLCLMLSRNCKCSVLTCSPCFTLLLQVSLGDLKVPFSHVETGKTRTTWPLSLQAALQRQPGSYMNILELCFPLNHNAFPRRWTISRETSGGESGGGEDSMEEQSSLPSKPTFQARAEGSSILSHMSLPG